MREQDLLNHYEQLDFIGQLKFIRDYYSDSIPEEIVHSTDENNMYKVRAAWWTMLNTVVYELELEKKASEELIKKGDKILEHRLMNVQRTGLTWPEDITAANNYLTEIIEILGSNSKNL